MAHWRMTSLQCDRTCGKLLIVWAEKRMISPPVRSPEVNDRPIPLILMAGSGAFGARRGGGVALGLSVVSVTGFPYLNT